MSPPGRPKGEYRSAQREGDPVSPPGRPKGEYRSAQREGSPTDQAPRRPRIVHLALKVDDLERTKAFYRDVFGFTEVATNQVRDHTSAHLTDGNIDFALLRYDADADSAESRAAGAGPCIHHFAVEVEDLAAAKAQILSYGCEIISDEGVVPIKFRAPGGTIVELVPAQRYANPCDGA